MKKPHYNLLNGAIKPIIALKYLQKIKDFDKILAYIENGHNVFITGGAGVGKSYVLSKLKEQYGKKLHMTSTTGISAINVGGQTLHSWAGIGLANKSTSSVVKKICKNPVLYKTLLCCKMLAIDEISMLDNITLDYVNEILKAIRENDKPFDGIQVIIVGDFFQFSPVQIKKYKKDFCFKIQI